MNLAALTRPGPFGPRTPELGVYLGIFDGGRLVAMAGERLQVGEWREISGVCTRPGYTGRGLAHQLVQVLIAQQQSRGERTFLHVMSANHRARQLYARLGFETYLETTVRVIERLASPDQED
jgi:predicted GNAT family acetyltransferase